MTKFSKAVSKIEKVAKETGGDWSAISNVVGEAFSTVELDDRSRVLQFAVEMVAKHKDA